MGANKFTINNKMSTYKNIKFTKGYEISNWLNKKEYEEIKLVSFDSQMMTIEIFYKEKNT